MPVAAQGNFVELRMHAGYDHGYHFIQAFVEEHVRWHARQLLRRHDAVRDDAAGDS